MSNPSLRERVLALRAKKANLTKEAKVRVAASWTVAKTLLPNAPAEVQKKFASSILHLDLPVLKSVVKQAAVNSFWSKFASDMEEAGAPLNKFVDDESLLAKLRKDVEKELKGEPKNASQKVADYEDPAAEQDALEAEEKVSLHDKIDEAESTIQDLEGAILDGEETPLDLENMFNETDEKVQDLANEESFDLGLEEGLGVDGDHGPSETHDMEMDLDGGEEEGISPTADFFMAASEEISDDFFKDVTAGEDVDTEAGEMADFFENSAVGDVQDAEDDHMDLIGEVAQSIKPATYETKRETEPHLEEPKVASRKKSARPVRSLGHVAISESEQSQLSKLVFPDDDYYE